MSDYNSSLPVRTETAGDIASKIVDGTITSQALTVNADGSINITDNGASLTVDATNLDIRDLTSASDSVTVLQATHDNLNLNANIQVGDADVANGNPVPVSDAGGSLTVDATDLDIRNLSAAQDNVAISDGTDTLAVNADGSINVAFAAGAEIKITDGTDDLEINADGSINSVVTATNLDIRDLTHVSDSVKVGDGIDFLAVNADGSINVKIADGTPGTSIVDYNTASAVAGGASNTHTYTSTGNFYLTQVEASGSGKMKIEIQVNAISKFVQFNSTSSPNMSISLSQPILATIGQTVTVIRTNRDNQSSDLYSTISGYNE